MDVVDHGSSSKAQVTPKLGWGLQYMAGSMGSATNIMN